MRGKDRPLEIGTECAGITPAYAGKSSKNAQRCIGHEDHPRICGEKCAALIMESCFLGSPPHMRGKGLVAVVPCVVTGITPAYAGKRLDQQQSQTLLEDHPRVCGEKNAILSGRKTEPGSPPRMRGKVLRPYRQGYD